MMLHLLLSLDFETESILFLLYTLIQIINQKANQQRCHQINVPTAPQVNISHKGMFVFIVAKAVTANGNIIANAIARSSKPVLTDVFTDAVTGFLTSIQPLPYNLNLCS
jgi:hypothetical protein